jgi:hypothetical protein
MCADPDMHGSLRGLNFILIDFQLVDSGGKHSNVIIEGERVPKFYC